VAQIGVIVRQLGHFLAIELTPTAGADTSQCRCSDPVGAFLPDKPDRRHSESTYLSRNVLRDTYNDHRRKSHGGGPLRRGHRNRAHSAPQLQDGTWERMWL
jgi:hypothetical protein